MLNVQKLSKMAKLNLPEAESEKMEKYMEVLVTKFDKLAEAGTDDVKPLIHATERTNVLRKDKVVKTISKETLLANAPERADGYFKVPKTVE